MKNCTYGSTDKIITLTKPQAFISVLTETGPSSVTKVKPI